MVGYLESFGLKSFRLKSLIYLPHGARERQQPKQQVEREPAKPGKA
jgi:hypothetical protein